MVTDVTGSLDLGSLIIGGTAVTSTAAEINVLDGIPGTLTATELGYVDGVTSAIQTQIDAKAPSASPTLTTPTLTTPTLTSAVTITGGTQSWTVVAAGVNLTFAYNGVNVLRVDSSGNLTALGDVNTNSGTIS